MSTENSASEEPAASPDQPTASSAAPPSTDQLNHIDAVRRMVNDEMQEVMQKFTEQLELAMTDGSRQRPEFLKVLDEFQTVIDEIEANLQCVIEAQKNTRRMWKMFHDEERRPECNMTKQGIADVAKQGDTLKGLINKAVDAVVKMRARQPLPQQEEHPKSE